MICLSVKVNIFCWDVLDINYSIDCAWENEQHDSIFLTRLGDDVILNHDMADAHSEKDDSDYDNNVDESGDEAAFSDESDND